MVCFPSSSAVPACSPVASDDLPAPAGTVVVALEAERVVVVLSGEVDIACAPQSRAVRAVVEQVGGPVVVDASRVTFIDAAALGDLVRLRRSCESWQLRRASPVVLRMLELTGLSELLGAPVPVAP